MWPGAAGAAPATARVPVTAAQVVRTDVAQRQVVSGTLGYTGSSRVVDELPGGIVTWLPAPGHMVRRDQVLYAIAAQPVVLLYGPMPAWRPFTPGMTAGRDVRELDLNLIALGFDPGHQITVSDQYGGATVAAVQRWQQAHGLPQTGSIPLGKIVFLNGPLRVTSLTATTGAPAGPGAAVLAGTSTAPAISVSMPVGGPVVKPGDDVQVTLPDGTTTPGTVTWVGHVATAAPPAAAGGPAQPATIPVTIDLREPRAAAGLDQAPVQVTITEQQHQGVLAVPVTALRARPGGGYEVITAGQPSGRVIPVTLGLFDDSTGLVEVAGPGLAPGQRVLVAQR